MEEKLIKANNSGKDIYQLALYDKSSDTNYIIFTIDARKSTIAGSMLQLTTQELREALKELNNILEVL